MVLSKRSDIPRSDVLLDGERLEQTNQFDYLGSLVTSDCKCNKEIRRIVLAKKAFTEKKVILADKKLHIKLRIRLLKYYVWSVLLYGCESWTISSNCRKKLEAVERWCYRRLTRISWVKKISNEQILDVVGMERSLVITNKERHLRFVEHVERKRCLEKLVLEGKIKGEKAKGNKEIGLHGGTGVGCWLRCAGCFAAGGWPGRFQRPGSQRQTVTGHPKKKKGKIASINGDMLRCIVSLKIALHALW